MLSTRGADAIEVMLLLLLHLHLELDEFKKMRRVWQIEAVPSTSFSGRGVVSAKNVRTAMDFIALGRASITLARVVARVLLLMPSSLDTIAHAHISINILMHATIDCRIIQEYQLQDVASRTSPPKTLKFAN